MKNEVIKYILRSPSIDHDSDMGWLWGRWAWDQENKPDGHADYWPIMLVRYGGFKDESGEPERDRYRDAVAGVLYLTRKGRPPSKPYKPAFEICYDTVMNVS